MMIVKLLCKSCQIQNVKQVIHPPALDSSSYSTYLGLQWRQNLRLTSEPRFVAVLCAVEAAGSESAKGIQRIYQNLTDYTYTVWCSFKVSGNFLQHWYSKRWHGYFSDMYFEHAFPDRVNMAESARNVCSQLRVVTVAGRSCSPAEVADSTKC